MILVPVVKAVACAGRLPALFQVMGQLILRLSLEIFRPAVKPADFLPDSRSSCLLELWSREWHESDDSRESGMKKRGRNEVKTGLRAAFGLHESSSTRPYVSLALAGRSGLK